MWIICSMLKLIVIVLLWLLLCLKMLWIPLMWLLRYKVNVMDCMHVWWLLLCFKWIYCLLVWLLRYEWTMKFYYCLWMHKTEKLWTLTLVPMACDLYFCNILIFTCTRFGPSLRVSDPWQIACYKFWDVVNIVIMLLDFG